MTRLLRTKWVAFLFANCQILCKLNMSDGSFFFARVLLNFSCILICSDHLYTLYPLSMKTNIPLPQLSRAKKRFGAKFTLLWVWVTPKSTRILAASLFWLGPEWATSKDGEDHLQRSGIKGRSCCRRRSWRGCMNWAWSLYCQVRESIRERGGPLTEEWHQRQVMLQKKILKRMHELGMISVLPGKREH